MKYGSLILATTVASYNLRITCTPSGVQELSTPPKWGSVLEECQKIFRGGGERPTHCGRGRQFAVRRRNVACTVDSHQIGVLGLSL